MPAALDRKRVDANLGARAVSHSGPGRGRPRDRGAAHHARNALPNGTYATTEKYLSQNRDVVERFTRAMNKSSAYASTHPDEARATIPKFTQIPPAVADKIRLPLWPTQIDRAQLQKLANYAVRYKVIKKAPPLDDLIWKGAQGGS
jgi:NitT/TauT family transport system substrate-binding protein